jgi:hypothetical protein
MGLEMILSRTASAVKIVSVKMMVLCYLLFPSRNAPMELRLFLLEFEVKNFCLALSVEPKLLHKSEPNCIAATPALADKVFLLSQKILRKWGK